MRFPLDVRKKQGQNNFASLDLSIASPGLLHRFISSKGIATSWAKACSKEDSNFETQIVHV